MKAWHVAVAGVLVSLGWFGAHASRSTGEPPRAAPRTRIGLVNMTYVTKNYGKFLTYQKELKKILEPFTEKDKGLRAKAEQLGKQMADPATPEADREKLADEVKKLQREMEGNNQEARAILSRRSNEQMKTIYEDVVNAAARYAHAHELDLVLHYNDGVTHQERFNPINIGRKLQNGALTPLYVARGLDISKDLVEQLNKAPGEGEDEPVEKKGR
jgi:Skp family chaperone for outer membrane proteins